MPEEVVATLKPGENLIAASCRNRAHGGLLDFGLAVEKEGQRSFVQIARQLSVEIQPMQTLYKFACGPVNLDLTFTAPLFMDDLELMARPVNYISYTVASTDGQKHAVELYFEASPQWAVDLAGQPSTAESFVDENLVFLKTGSRDQKVLAKKEMMSVLIGDIFIWLPMKRILNMLLAVAGSCVKVLLKANSLLPERTDMTVWRWYVLWAKRKFRKGIY